ncbi:hypothetical protein [Streptomyces zhihengii]|uniref:Uncharacterized protein n=1 Tax=Streptomyces zhihengii TaxID=1818004 RepID=A0ABS2V3M0_9ACTN|nr:hypothetical protein [Streptomyces zhihengii]MBM9624442.1 hypothetical protein [Streptomyces zhihengii]
MSANEWAGLSANLKFQGGFAVWDIGMLVHLYGAKKAGARIIESIELKLADNKIGHLPTKLPTDGTRRVLLYAKDHVGLGYVINQIHTLAIQAPEAGENATVYQLQGFLNSLSTLSNHAYRPPVVSPWATPEEHAAAESRQQRRRTAELAYIRSYYGLENRQDIQVDLGVRVRLRGHEGKIVDTQGTEFLMVLLDGSDKPLPRRVSPDLEFATPAGWVTVPEPNHPMTSEEHAR